MNTQKLIQTFAILCLGSASVFATGCGKSIVTAVGVSSSIQLGDQYADVYADFNTSGISLPSVTLPIFNPLSPGTTYGSVALASTSSSSQVTIGLDLTVVAKLPSGSALLPNGNTVPVSGTEQTRLLSIPVPTTKFVVYVALQINALQPGQSPVAMVGIAMPFTQLDSIGSSLGNAELFIPFSISSISGTAGMFTGKTGGTTGFGIFIDASGLIQSVSPASATSLVESRAVEQNNSRSHTSAKLGFLGSSPGYSKEIKISNDLSRLGQEHTVLTTD